MNKVTPSPIYIYIKKNKDLFRRISGIELGDFNSIVEQVRGQYETEFTKQTNVGRKKKFVLEDLLLCTFMYLRTYATQEFIGILFRVHQAQVSRCVHKGKILLTGIMEVSKLKREVEALEIDHLLQEIDQLKQQAQEECEQSQEAEQPKAKYKKRKILIDATEQQIQRPTTNQEKYYSGKKKKHTIKTQIVIDEKGEILYVSDSYEGTKHDFSIFKEELEKDEALSECLKEAETILADSGYQGIQDSFEQSVIPIKKKKNKALSQEDKEHNQSLSKIRVKVEHIFGDLKVFKILSYPFRNKKELYNDVFKILAWIVNVKNGFLKIA